VGTSASEKSSLPHSLEPALAAVDQTLSWNNDPSIDMADPSVVPQRPFRGSGRIPFYDGVGDVVQINISYSSQVVWSVQANYRQKTTDVFKAASHGSKGPQVAEVRNFNPLQFNLPFDPFISIQVSISQSSACYIFANVSFCFGAFRPECDREYSNQKVIVPSSSTWNSSARLRC